MSIWTLIRSLLGGVLLTIAIAWLIATRALDTTSPGITAWSFSPTSIKDVTRYERFGSTDVRCLSGHARVSGVPAPTQSPDAITPVWMRDILIPWGWNTEPPPSAYEVRTIKISGWPLPCLYSVYRAVPSPAVWPHRAISGLVISDTWTGFGVQWPGEMPVAFPYRPRWGPLLVNIAFYTLVVLTFTRGIGWVRRARRRKSGRCPWCAYDLRGLAPGSQCPECGRGALASPSHISRTTTEPAA